MASYTKQEIKEIAITAPLTGYVAGTSPATVLPGDTILQAFQKRAGNDTAQSVLIGALQVGNNLFNYYNFR